MTKNYIFILTIVFFSLTAGEAWGQGTAPNKAISEEYEIYTDSLMRTPYRWHMPILGAKLRKMGFDLPYPNGIGVSYAYSNPQLTISDLAVGFSENDLVNVDGVARFSSLESNANAFTFRYDVWLLPFINVYGLAGRVTNQTSVNLALPFEATFKTKVSSSTSVGWGVILAGGYGPVILSANYAQAWTYTSSLDKPAKGNILEVRAGHMFRFKKHPARNLVVLVGAGYLGLNKFSSGKADLNNMLGITNEDKQRMLGQLNGWYDGLTESEQEIFGGIYNGLEGWLSKNESSYLYYQFNKKLYYPWSMSVGANYQIDKRFSVLGMYYFLGSRQQAVIGFNYRFGIRGKNFLHGFTL